MEPNENNTMNLGANVAQTNYTPTSSTGVYQQAQIMQNNANMQAQAQVVQPSTTVPQSYTPENPQNIGVVTNNVMSNQQPVSTPQFTQTFGYVDLNPHTNILSEQTVTITSDSVEPQTINMNTIESNGPIQNMTSQVVEQPQQPTEVKTEQPKPELVPSKDVIISVKELQELVSRCKKVAVNEPLIPLSRLFYIVIGKDGFSISADNIAHTITTVNRARSYEKDIKMCVDAVKFGDLVMNLSEGLVRFEFDEMTHVLTLFTDSGYFKFSESVDSTSGTSITIQHRFTQDYDTMKSIQIKELKDTVNKTKPIRAAAGSEKQLQCIYFGDVVICSDGGLIFMQEGVPSLRDEEFFIDSKTADLFAAIDFEEDKTRAGIIKNEMGETQAVILNDSYTVLSVRTAEEVELPVDVCKNFWGKTFPDRVTLNTTECSAILKRAQPFIDVNSDAEFAEFSIVGNTLTLSTLSGQSKETVSAVNPENKTLNIKMPVKKILGILQTISESTYAMTSSLEMEECVCLTYGNYKCVVALG